MHSLFTPTSFFFGVWRKEVPKQVESHMLPKKAIEEFKRIYRKSYNIELTNEEAADKANRLVQLYRAVYSDSPFGRVELPKKSNHEAQ